MISCDERQGIHLAYIFYIDGVPLPVAPSKMKLSMKNRNGSTTLLSGEEVSILKSPGLTEVSFEALLPQQKYPFGYYPDGFIPASFYLNRLEKLKKEQKPFQFLVSRVTPEGRLLHDTNLKVSLEDYAVDDDAGEGLDVKVSVRLKEYRAFGLKQVENTGNSGGAVGSGETRDSKTPAKSYVVKKGDCLYNICKAQLGRGDKCWEIAKLNGIQNPNLIYPGQVIVLG